MSSSSFSDSQHVFDIRLLNSERAAGSHFVLNVDANSDSNLAQLVSPSLSIFSA